MRSGNALARARDATGVATLLVTPPPASFRADDDPLPDADLVASARRGARAQAEALGREDLADDVTLVVSELVTNAVLHGGGCRGVSVAATASGLRVEVRDRSRIPPMLGHASEASLTGRGVRVVGNLASRWGVDAEPDGKLIWVELDGSTSASGSALPEADLLALWDDEWDDAESEPRFHVELGNVPTDLLLAAKSHVDNIAREFALVSSVEGFRGTDDAPSRLASLLEAVEAFAEARLGIKQQALAADRAGAMSTSLVLDLPARAADAAEAYLTALDEIDSYCRAGRFLTLETPPQHRVFRQWYIGELVRQLRAAANGDPAPLAEPFDRRLLAELDRVVAAERNSQRAARLYSVAAALATAGTPEAVADAVLMEGVAALRASGGGLLLATDADRLALSGAVGYDDAVVARLREESPDADLPAATALRTGEPVWLESREERDERFPALAGVEADTIALCAVPLEVQGRHFGALRFSFTEPRLFDEEERRFVLTFASQTAQALERAQLQRARVDVSLRLQRSLLPPSLPEVSGLDVAAIYHPFGDGIDVGGDMYDLWAVDHDRWALVVGDASGTGPEAAALTAVVRHTLRALTMVDNDPETVLERLNTALLRAGVAGNDRYCTAIFGFLTVDGGAHLHLASGGHPPVLIRRGGATIEEVVVGGRLLGLLEGPAAASARIVLAPGDTAVLLTDGVLEARRDDDLFGIEGVERALQAATGGAEAITIALEREVLAFTGGVLRDDMAAVVLQVPTA